MAACTGLSTGWRHHVGRKVDVPGRVRGSLTTRHSRPVRLASSWCRKNDRGRTKNGTRTRWQADHVGALFPAVRHQGNAFDVGQPGEPTQLRAGRRGRPPPVRSPRPQLSQAVFTAPFRPRPGRAVARAPSLLAHSATSCRRTRPRPAMAVAAFTTCSAIFPGQRGPLFGLSTGAKRILALETPLTGTDGGRLRARLEPSPDVRLRAMENPPLAAPAGPRRRAAAFTRHHRQAPAH